MFGDGWDDAGAVRRRPPGKRGAFLHARLVALGGHGISVRRLGGDRAGEVRLTRLLHNPAVTLAEMIETAAAATQARCAGRHVLAIQDTTVIRSEGGGGLYLHPVIAVDAQDGALLGVVHAAALVRTAGRRQDRRSRPVDDKESGRWLVGAAQAAQVCAAAQAITVVADRESYIYEAFARRPAGVHLLVRAAQDRALDDGARLFARLDGLAEDGRTRLRVPAQPGRPARDAVLAIRFADLTLARPKNGPRRGPDGPLPASVSVTVVDVREVDPQTGERVAGGVHWRLLTTHAVAGLADALTQVELYRRRWCIEQIFRTMKTKGFDIEALRIGEPEVRFKLVTATLIAAVTIQQLVHARDGDTAGGPLRPITDVVDPDDLPLMRAFCAELEGKTARQKNPHPPGALAYAAWVCARLGGWTGYYGKPGPTVMLAGWLTFQAAKRGARLQAKIKDV